MEYRRLGRTGLKVSVICLGTMTWGEQNTEAEAHAQLDYALERGINFIDTAEMYPVPPKPETGTRTESYIGSWIKARKNRDKFILATKVAGRSFPGRGDVSKQRGPGITHSELSKAQITQAVEGSLKRLNTDYIDLYQTHWPDRPVNNFGTANYVHQEFQSIPIEETLETMRGLVKAGKLRHVGVSNETPWGVMEHLKLAETKGLPRIASIQNPYNLLNRLFEVGLAEPAHREEVSLLAYSPLAMGMLTGKYMGGAKPEGARLTLFSRFQRYSSPQSVAASERYVLLARQHGIDPAQMALAYVNSRPFVTANIIGATSLAQLKSDIDSISVTLPDAVVQGIEAIHKDYPYPSA